MPTRRSLDPKRYRRWRAECIGDRHPHLRDQSLTRPDHGHRFYVQAGSPLLGGKARQRSYAAAIAGSREVSWDPNDLEAQA